MPQPLKEKMPYFSHESDARGDRKVKLFIAHTGFSGYGFWWAILEEIYKNSYYMPWSEEDMVLFASEFNCTYSPVSIENVRYYMDQSFKWNLLNRDVFETYGVLTSPSIQRRYLKQSSRRTLAEIVAEYALINISEFYEKELKSASLSIKVVSIEGQVLDVFGDYEESNRPTPSRKKDEPAESKYDSKYDFSSTEKWDGKQPIDYVGCVDVWNQITGGRARITRPKRNDLKRVFNVYTGKECMDAMIVRAKDERMKDSKYLTQWDTLFGAKKMENLDKWVERGKEWLKGQRQLQTVSDHLKQGWVQQKEYQKICERAGIDFSDPMFCEVKRVENQMLYYPKFSY